MMCIHDEEQCRLAAALAYARRLHASVEQKTEATSVAVGPVLLLHLLAVGPQPGRILDAELFIILRREEPCLAQHGIALAKRGHPFDEPVERFPVLVDLPVDPGDLVVLAIGIVVAVLRAAE